MRFEPRPSQSVSISIMRLRSPGIVKKVLTLGVLNLKTIPVGFGSKMHNYSQIVKLCSGGDPINDIQRQIRLYPGIQPITLVT